MIPGEFIKQHYHVAKLIAEATPAERIYLLGSTVSQVCTATVFTEAAPGFSFVSHCYVLVLTNKSDTNSCHCIQDKIENYCRSYIPVTAIVLDVQQYNEWLATGHHFAMRVSKTAECLYDAGNVQHVLSTTATDEHQLAKTNEVYYNLGLNKFQEFLAGADLYRIREQNKMAAFMLHQAAEQALHTLFRITTGMYVNTHSLDKLIRYCSMVSHKLQSIFPRNNEKNEQLFRLLQKAYIDARYKENYSIAIEDLKTITERIRALEGILKDAYSSLKK